MNHGSTLVNNRPPPFISHRWEIIVKLKKNALLLLLLLEKWKSNFYPMGSRDESIKDGERGGRSRSTISREIRLTVNGE